MKIPTFILVLLFIASCSTTENIKTGKSPDTNNLPEMVNIPAGSYKMGCITGVGCDPYNSKPVHLVTLKTFQLSKTEITFDQWKACVDAGGCKRNPTPKDNDWGRGKMPVIYVTWNDAKEYLITHNPQPTLEVAWA